MEELNLKEAWQAVIRKLPHIIIIMLVCALLTNVFNNVLGKDSYSSKVSIMVGSPEDFEKEGAVVSKVDAMINTQLVSNVEQLIKSNSVLDTVAEKVGNGVSSSDLRKDLKVKSVPSTSIIEMEYSSESAEQTNKVLEESLKAITDLTKKTMKKDNIQVVDAPNAKKKIKQLVNKMDTAIGLFLGMLIGLAYAFASYYKDPNIFCKEQLQNKLGLETVSVLSNDYNESSNSALRLLNRRIDSFDNVGVFSFDQNTSNLAKAYNSNFDKKITAVSPISEKVDLTDLTKDIQNAIVLYKKDDSRLGEIKNTLEAIKSLGINPVAAVEISKYNSDDKKYLPYA